MSRAFVNEDSGTGVEDLPDLPQSPHPNYVTPQGLAALQGRLKETRARHAALSVRRDETDAKLPLAVAERDIRFLEQRIAGAIPVDPSAQPPGVVAFGATVEVTDEDGNTRTYRIVGEDEADPAKGLIAPFSPLATTLIGCEAGDTATWRKPSGDVELEVTAIRFG